MSKIGGKFLLQFNLSATEKKKNNQNEPRELPVNDMAFIPAPELEIGMQITNEDDDVVNDLNRALSKSNL